MSTPAVGGDIAEAQPKKEKKKAMGCRVINATFLTGFYTSEVFLQYSHTLVESDVVLSCNWMSMCGVVLCDGGLSPSGLLLEFDDALRGEG